MTPSSSDGQPVALITGAAGGIGTALTREFAGRGYRCALVDTDVESLTALAKQLEASGAKVLSLAGDLADLDFARSTVAKTHTHFGQLDVLVNNAAWREVKTMREMTVESWEKTLRVCLTTPAFLARWAAEVMQPRGTGVIVNISSMMSQQTGGISPSYVAAKGGLDSLTYELATLYGPVGIRVVAINPGAIDTELCRDHSADKSHSPDEVRVFSEDMIALGRWGVPEEIAKAVAWVAGPEASYVTGTTLLVDGGWFHQHTPYSLKRKQQPGQFP